MCPAGGMLQTESKSIDDQIFLALKLSLIIIYVIALKYVFRSSTDNALVTFTIAS